MQFHKYQQNTRYCVLIPDFEFGQDPSDCQPQFERYLFTYSLAFRG